MEEIVIVRDVFLFVQRPRMLLAITHSSVLDRGRLGIIFIESVEVYCRIKIDFRFSESIVGPL